MNNYQSVEPHELTQKELKDQELISIHKAVLDDYIRTNLHWDSTKRHQVNAKYDEMVTRNNIRQYYNYHVGIFLLALLQDKLTSIANYTYKHQPEDEDEDYED